MRIIRASAWHRSPAAPPPPRRHHARLLNLAALICALAAPAPVPPRPRWCRNSLTSPRQRRRPSPRCLCHVARRRRRIIHRCPPRAHLLPARPALPHRPRPGNRRCPLQCNLLSLRCQWFQRQLQLLPPAALAPPTTKVTTVLAATRASLLCRTLQAAPPQCVRASSRRATRWPPTMRFAS